MQEICESLKTEREKKGISLKQISQKTNISVNSLKALEDGDFHLIPGKFYIKHYLKNYLQAIEVDQKEFLTSHRDGLASIPLNNLDSSENYIPKLRYSRFKRKNIFLTLFSVLMIIIILSAGLFYLYQKDKLPEWLSLFDSPKLPATGIIPDDAKIEFSIDRSPVNVRLEFLDTCWALVRRGRTERIEKTYKKGDRFVLRGYELFFYIGNPSAVKFYLNGREVSYLNTLTQPEKLDVNPATIERILEK